MKEITPLEAARRAGFAKYVERLQQPDEIAKRFWQKVNKNGPIPAHMPELGPCWLWQGAAGGKTARILYPYGMFRFRGKNWPAHRVAFLFAHGEFDQSLNILHHCDTPLCVRWHHLFAGTDSDNVQDAMKKGRWFKPTPQPGEANPMHALTEEDVLKIRALHQSGAMNQRQIARQFGVNFRTVNLIVLRINWKHI